MVGWPCKPPPPKPQPTPPQPISCPWLRACQTPPADDCRAPGPPLTRMANPTPRRDVLPRAVPSACCPRHAGPTAHQPHRAPAPPGARPHRTGPATRQPHRAGPTAPAPTARRLHLTGLPRASPATLALPPVGSLRPPLSSPHRFLSPARTASPPAHAVARASGWPGTRAGGWIVRAGGDRPGLGPATTRSATAAPVTAAPEAAAPEVGGGGRGSGVGRRPHISTECRPPRFSYTSGPMITRSCGPDPPKPAGTG